MDLSNNLIANIAYIEHFKANNPKLNELKCSGKYLEYLGERIDISDIYIQDVLTNRNLFESLKDIDANELFIIIKLHCEAIQIKEQGLINKIGELNYE